MKMMREKKSEGKLKRRRSSSSSSSTVVMVVVVVVVEAVVSGSTVAYRIVLSTYNQRVGGSIPPSAYAPKQGILSTVDGCLSRPRCSKWALGRNVFLEMLQRQWQQGLKPG